MLLDIIGGSGFIGSRLCERINNNNEILFSIIDKVPSHNFSDSFKFADVRSINSLRNVIRHGSTIINLAAEHRDDVTPASLYDEVNVVGAKNICIVANEKNIKTIIFTSSVAVYGFTKIGANESSEIKPFNNYGRTKWEAETVYRNWQMEDPAHRRLVIIRPTVVFGEKNRGNVYNLLKQISSGRFLMVGSGLNRKSMVYVENIAAFIEFSFQFNFGIHVFNYVDKPDFTMNKLVQHVNVLLGKNPKINFRIPYFIGLFIGKIFDLIAIISHKKFSISSIRIKKFCSNSIYTSAVEGTGFLPPITLIDGISKTIQYEFLDNNKSDNIYYSE